jgi:hypothetical protein
VRISLIDRVTTGLMGLSRQFAKVHGNAKALQSQIDKIKLLTMGGAVVAGTGLFGLAMIGKTVPAAKEYVHQLQQMNIAGMKHAEIARAIKAAWDTNSSVPTSSTSENLAAIRELRMVFGNTNDAIANMPVVQRLQAILANTKGGMSGGHDEAYTVAKALEMKGAVRNPAEFNIQADQMAKAIVASGGEVGASDFLSAFKFGRSATLGWNDRFTYSILPTLIQEMKNAGGSGGTGGPGNALMSVYDHVVNGKIAQKDLGIWGQIGLLDPSKVVRTKTGATKGVLPGGVRGWELFQQDPYAWTQNVLMPAMMAHGITKQADQMMLLGRLGGSRTSGFMLQQMGMQGWKFDRDQKLIRGASGLAAYNQLVKNDPMMADLALQKQWKNLLTVIGIQIMPALIDGTLKLISGLTGLSNWMRDHPNLTKGLVIGFVALSAAMAIGGTIMMIAGGFAAIGLAAPVVAAGFGLVVGALGLLFSPVTLTIAAMVALGLAIRYVWKHWDTIKPKLLGVFNAIFNGISGFINGLHNLLPFIPTMPGSKGGPPLKQYPKTHGLPGSPNATGHHPLRQWFESFGHQGKAKSAYIHPGTSNGSGMVGDVHMDGHKVGKVVWRHQTDALGRPPSSGAAYDPAFHLTPVGANGFAT